MVGREFEMKLLGTYHQASFSHPAPPPPGGRGVQFIDWKKMCWLRKGCKLADPPIPPSQGSWLELWNLLGTLELACVTTKKMFKKNC